MARSFALLAGMLGLFLGLSRPGIAQFQQPPARAAIPSLKGHLPDKQANFELKLARLPDVMGVFARETGLPVLADAFPDDPTVDPLKVENVPLYVAVEQVPQLYGREALLVEDVLVLRHTNHVGRQRYTSAVVRWTTLPGGRGTIQAAKGEEKTPALRAAVRDISAGALGQQVTEALRTPFSVQRPLAERRVSLYGDRISPTKLAAALAVLLNGSPAITLRQTEEQRAAEEEEYQRVSDQRNEADRRSDDLKKELMRLLTAEQQQKLQNQQDVEIPLRSLPPKVQQQARDYARLIWSRIAGNIGENQLLDVNRPMGLVLHPAGNLRVAVDAFLEDGTKYRF